MGALNELPDATYILISNELLRAQIAELAKKGFGDPGLLSEDEVWHVCRAMLSYLSGFVPANASAAPLL